MTNRDKDLKLGAGTVPDPFGLTWHHEQDATDETTADREDPGPDDPTEADEQHVRLGELD